MRLSSLFPVFLLIAPTAFAIDTLDPKIEYYSDVTLVNFSSGQIEGGRYFCVKGVNHGGDVVACAVSNKSEWTSSYDQFFQQAYYYYTTGNKVRLYVQPNVWTNPKFIHTFSNKAIAGFASCNDGFCMGPTR